MGFGSVWAIAATWLSAHCVISVIAELAGAWLCIAAVFLGAWFSIDCTEERNKKFLIGLSASGLGLFVMAWAWFISDLAFFHWKLKSVPPAAWEQMTSDMHQIANSTSEVGYFAATKMVPPPV